jgi:hypothetical protein
MRYHLFLLNRNNYLHARLKKKGLMASFGKSPKGYDAFSTLNPQQMSILQQLLGSMQGQQGNIQQNPLYQGASSYLQNLYSNDEGAFDAFEAPYKRQFNEETIPGLAERFSGMGAGAQNSSAFQQALGQAGSGLTERLASLRGNLQLGALPHAMQYAQQPFQNILELLNMQTHGYVQKPQKSSFLKNLGLGLGGGFSNALGSGLGGGWF